MTAKSEGLRKQKETVDAGVLLDVADYAAYVAMMLEELFDLEFGAADSKDAV